MHPDSLVTKIFKAKYFSRDDFLDAELGHNPSYAWRSIWMSKALVKKGVRWSIGGGDSIPIWESPWLCNGESLSCPIGLPFELQHLSISDLWVHGSKCWNEAFIGNFLPTQIAEKIIKTPLNELVSGDRIIWGPNKNGLYSVKSAY